MGILTRLYLHENAHPAHNGKRLGQINIIDAARELSIKPVELSGQLSDLLASGYLESLKIGGRDGMQAFYLIAGEE